MLASANFQQPIASLRDWVVEWVRTDIVSGSSGPGAMRSVPSQVSKRGDRVV